MACTPLIKYILKIINLKGWNIYNVKSATNFWEQCQYFNDLNAEYAGKDIITE